MSENQKLIRHWLPVRQLEILNLAVEDELYPKQIADKLCISLSTVRGHVLEIKESYKTTSWTIAVIRYMKELQLK